MSLFELLFCYGLTFGLMNKTSWIQNRYQLLDDMLSCSYCTGFHSGWIAYFMLNPTLQIDPVSLITWSFASAAFSYVLDTAVAYLEQY